MRVIYWFRQDLRLSDNPALYEAAKNSEILPVYILNDHDDKTLGGASKWWLHYSLIKLKRSLNGKLLVLKGNPIELLLQLVNQYKIDYIYWNKSYEKHNKDYDINLQNIISNCKIYNGNLLWDPSTILKPDGTPYRIFTLFYRNGCLQNVIKPRLPLESPKNLRVINCTYPDENDILRLELLSKFPWYEEFNQHWKVGETAAMASLNKFISNGLSNYKIGRDFPAENYVSKLSPHLHFGEISPNQIWYSAIVNRDKSDKNLDHFLSELGWREFAYNLLYHCPNIQSENLNKKFDKFPWVIDNQLVEKWQNGETGFPIIDAGMRELWATGYMHNRVRMIVASFLVKNLLVDWRHGERWFWDCLVDADMANNSASWQWVAGCGTDASPYYRIFNPVLQAEKFDPNCLYIRKYLPEIAHLPNELLFRPWLSSDEIPYPKPIVQLDDSRNRALQAFLSLNN